MANTVAYEKIKFFAKERITQIRKSRSHNKQISKSCLLAGEERTLPKKMVWLNIGIEGTITRQINVPEKVICLKQEMK